MAKKKKNNIPLKDQYILLALDPSLACTGASIISITHKEPFNYKDANGNGINLELLDYSTIPTYNIEEESALLLIEKRINEYFDKYQIDYVTSEAPFASANRVVIQRLAAVSGVLKLTCIKFQKKIRYYSVMSAKSQVLPKLELKNSAGERKSGLELKEEVAQEIFKIFGKDAFIKPFTNDITDAISIGICFINMAGKEVEKKKKSKKTKNIKNKEIELKNSEKGNNLEEITKSNKKESKNNKTKTKKIKSENNNKLINAISDSITDILKNKKEE